MSKLEVGQVYTNGKQSREITKIENNEIYYKTETGKEKQCWITTFVDWVKKAEKNNQVLKTWQMLKEFTESKTPEKLKAYVMTESVKNDELYPYEYISLLDGVFYWNNDFKKPFHLNQFYNSLQIEWMIKK